RPIEHFLSPLPLLAKASPRRVPAIVRVRGAGRAGIRSAHPARPRARTAGDACTACAADGLPVGGGGDDRGDACRLPVLFVSVEARLHAQDAERLEFVSYGFHRASPLGQDGW